MIDVMVTSPSTHYALHANSRRSSLWVRIGRERRGDGSRGFTRTYTKTTATTDVDHHHHIAVTLAKASSMQGTATGGGQPVTTKKVA